MRSKRKFSSTSKRIVELAGISSATADTLNGWNVIPTCISTVLSITSSVPDNSFALDSVKTISFILCNAIVEFPYFSRKVKAKKMKDQQKQYFHDMYFLSVRTRFSPMATAGEPNSLHLANIVSLRCRLSINWFRPLIRR